MTADLAPSPFSAFLSGSAGDVAAARACADALLTGHDGSLSGLASARLLLTAACLYLYPITGPDPALSDLQALLISLAASDPSTRAALARSAAGVVQYISMEFFDGRGLAQQEAISLAVEAVRQSMHTNP